MQDTRLLVDTVETGRRLGCGRTKVYELIADGDLESVKIGRRRKVPVDSINDYVSRLRAAQNGASAA